MLKRNIWQELIEWKNREHNPLVIRGLRQIGKTFSIEKLSAGEGALTLSISSAGTGESAFGASGLI